MPVPGHLYARKIRLAELIDAQSEEYRSDGQNENCSEIRQNDKTVNVECNAGFHKLRGGHVFHMQRDIAKR